MMISMKTISVIGLMAVLTLPVSASAQTVEITNIEMTTASGDVIRAGDSTGKMVTIYGGETGREVFNMLTRRASDESLSDRDRLIADLLQTILLNRWRALD